MEQTHGSQNLKAKGTLYLSGASNKPTAQPSIHLLPMLLVSPGSMARTHGKQGRYPSTAYHSSQSWQNLPGVS